MFLVLCFCLLSPFVLSVLASHSILEHYTVVRIRPRGFRISIPVEKDSFRVFYQVNIEKPIRPPQTGDFAAIIEEPTDNAWNYDNVNVYVHPNSSIHFWVSIHYTSTQKKNFITYAPISALVPEDSIELEPAFCTKNDIGFFPRINKFEKESKNCILSMTTVGHKPTCKGQLIFEDNFSTLNLTTWTRDVRMPFDPWDAPFVSFQDRWENCFTIRGTLYIEPTLQSEVPDFNEFMIENGSLELEDCTGAPDKPWECSRQAKYWQILPPVVSAKLHTKNSFSFRYGKIIIGADLPAGDWMIPLILLEPVEHFYGTENYVSGQINIVYSQGNAFLSHDIDDTGPKKMAFGNVLISSDPKFAGHTTRGPHFLSPGFHIFALKWTEDDIRFSFDNEFVGVIQNDFSNTYSYLDHAKQWEKGTRMAPFDREFFLSLGVSVGGHFDFADARLNKPWKNGDPKAMLNFWEKRHNWRKTWENKGLAIDFIRVYAL